MKILLYCYAFYPSIGGIESTTKTLADSMTDLGHTCTVVTETESQDPDNFRYQISRKPSRKEILVPIISRYGGLKEIVGDEGLTFTNGNWMELYERMNEIIYNPELREKQRSKRKEQMSKFDPEKITSEFLSLFHSALK